MIDKKLYSRVHFDAKEILVSRATSYQTIVKIAKKKCMSSFHAYRRYIVNIDFLGHANLCYIANMV